MPDRLLERSVLCDALLLYYSSPEDGGCIRKNLMDGSLWLQTNSELAGGARYFVIENNKPGWGSILKDKVHFKAIANRTNKTLTNIEIENFKEGYKSEIRILNLDNK